MKVRFNIKVQGNETYIGTPYYCPEFVTQIKSKLGARNSDGEDYSDEYCSCWIIKTEDLNIAKEIIMNVYGNFEGNEVVLLDQNYIKDIGPALCKSVLVAINELYPEKPCFDAMLWRIKLSNDELLKLYDYYYMYLQKIYEKSIEDAEHHEEFLFIYDVLLDGHMKSIVKEIIKRSEENSLDCDTKEYKDVLEQAKKILHDTEEK